ncbi:MAG: pentapeptide repeat-containing protein, partial [Candidatus Bathyarchaeota archaeon]|nr:pentapeptide repeat-containing protein [Candidatus Bathyarchaeota archaeon]
MVPGPSENKKKQKPPHWLIDNIAEASKNARRIYLLYVSFLAYCALTVATTSDRQIILDDVVRLPFLHLDVSLIGFFIIAPLAVIFLFIYLQLYLARIKGLITDLRGNYAPIEKRRLYPWMLNIAEDPEAGSVGKLQEGVTKISLWWLLPLILVLFALWFVKKHDPILSYVIGGVFPVLGTLSVIYFWCCYEGVQCKFKFKIKGVPGFLLNQRNKTILVSLVLIFEIFLLFFIIPWAMRGGVKVRNEYMEYIIGSEPDFFLKPWICVDLSYQVLATKPEEEYERIYWVDLKKAHLEGADLTCTILKKADLRSAYFQQAEMAYINLQGANLWNANLQGANLVGADLQGASLGNANLQGANLGGANLQKANFWGADLQGVFFLNANLQGARLVVANLQG